MEQEFLKKQNQNQQDSYEELLQLIGSLSNLFSDSEVPYLYYRAMENIFCKAFEAENLSRSDVSVDASKNKIGIGLKTFLHQNGKTFQKIAEFNRESYLFRNLEEKDLIKKVSTLRNKRIEATKNLCDLDDVMYHVVTRDKNKMMVYEEHMDYIDIEKIELKKVGKNTIQFTDNHNFYSYSISKSTLLKKFDVDKLNHVNNIEVEIMKEPYEFLLSKTENISIINKEMKSAMFEDYIILPLYSYSSGKVEEKSGLNMWNAGGRTRNDDEVYIPIPRMIHEHKSEFFKCKDDSCRNTNAFKVILPNNKILSMKVTQQGGKALQSDPNKELGKWILRDVLKLEPGTLVTKEMLDNIGIDSIKLSKVNNELYYMDFLQVGSFEDYVENVLSNE